MEHNILNCTKLKLYCTEVVSLKQITAPMTFLSTYLNFKCSLYFNSNSIILVLSALQVWGSSVVELLGPVTRVAGLIPVSWSSGKWFGLESLFHNCRTHTLSVHEGKKYPYGSCDFQTTCREN